MEYGNDVWSVLSKIRADMAADPPSERTLREAAYFKWQRRGEKGIPGSQEGDLFAAARMLERRSEFWRLEECIRAMESQGKRKIRFSLVVVSNLATWLHMRPTDIRPGTPLDELEWAEKGMIVAGIGYDLEIKLLSPGYAANAASFIDQLWGHYQAITAKS
jgi:hypothetical protein